MPKLRSLVVAGALGAAASYFLDPQRGRARRTRARAQLDVMLRRGRVGMEQRTGYGANGAGAGRPDRAYADPVADDLTVLSRFESEVMGRPGFPKGRVNANVVDGRLTLRGELESEDEIRSLVEAASGVGGVVEVVNLLHLPGTPAPHEDEGVRP
jgi:BON domain